MIVCNSDASNSLFQIGISLYQLKYRIKRFKEKYHILHDIDCDKIEDILKNLEDAQEIVDKQIAEL
jgi:hypothetical protein